MAFLHGNKRTSTLEAEANRILTNKVYGNFYRVEKREVLVDKWSAELAYI